MGAALTTDFATACPVCSGNDLTRTVERAQIPAMQNYVYRTREKALLAKSGQLRLDVCQRCGFAFNALFNPALLDYDEGYDNTVPSQVMSKYYEELATYLHEAYLPQGGLLVDIGCGKGTFLQTMCRLFPDTRGLGIDPSYEGPLQNETGSLRYIREMFSEDQLTDRPSLVICRHVMEHIHRPVEFLASLCSASKAYKDVPFFVEVPDLNWIIQNRAFWDYCYEHCNYFTPNSLSNAMTLAGFRTVRSRTAYGDQYIWMEATNTAAPAPPPFSSSDALELVHRVTKYTQGELQRIEQARACLTRLKNEGSKIVLWGMATKGILFAYLVDPQRTLLAQCVDINPNKQSCFVPVTGHAIESPEGLLPDSSCRIVVVVMNTNYLVEVAMTCQQRGLHPLFLSASGEVLSRSMSES